MSVQYPPQPHDEGGSKYESIKVERNTRGYNWSIRVVKQDGQTDTDWLRRLAALESQVRQKFGGE